MSLERDPGDPAREERGTLASLLARVAGGDEVALRELHDATRRRLQGLVRAIVGNALADEVLVETYVQVWREAARYDRRRGSALAWLATLARSRAVDRLRARGQREELLLAGEQLDELMSTAPGPEQASEGEERALLVRSAVLRLPPEQRRAIAAAFFRGLTHQEVAVALDQPLGTVKTRIRAGLTALRRALAGQEGAETAAAPTRPQGGREARREGAA